MSEASERLSDIFIFISQKVIFQLLLLYIIAAINLLLIMVKCMVHHRVISIHLHNMRERAKPASATERYNCSFMNITTDITVIIGLL